MPGSVFQPLIHSLSTLSFVACDLVRLLVLVSRSRRALAAENLFLRKQLALFQERKVKPQRADDSTRLIMVILGRLFAWRDALVNVQPDTFIRWHRKGFRLLWRWKSRPLGRPRIPKDLRRLIREMAAENPTWGEERIANELKLKLTIRVPLRLRCHGDRIPPDSSPERHGPSHVGMDAAATPGSPAGRSSVSFRHPRSRQYLLCGRRQESYQSGGTGSAYASAGAQGERGVRATGRQPSSRMSRLLDSNPRTPSSHDYSG